MASNKLSRLSTSIEELSMNETLDDASLLNILLTGKVSPVHMQQLKAKAEKDVRSVAVKEFIQEAVHNPRICVIDVRSETEFAKGHIPCSFSLPLLSDQERHTVGLCFTKNGFGPAMGSGMRFVRNKLDSLKERLKEVVEGVAVGSVQDSSSGGACEEVDGLYDKAVHTTTISDSSSMSPVVPSAAKIKIGVYCFRGRMRSLCISWWFQQLGYEVVLLKGGYKGYREWALNLYAEGPPICVVGGRTGSGKTRILHALRAQGAQILDLEGLANHRGSSFGWVAQQGQPNSEQYQNKCAMAWLELNHQQWVYVEDEASNVGTCTVPPMLYKKVRAAPLIIKVVLPIEARLHLLLEDYTGAEARANTEDYLPRLRESIGNMSKRLGGQKTKEVLELFDQGDARGVIFQLITHYDKLYDKHVANATGNGSGTGEREGVIVSVEADSECSELDADDIAGKMQLKASEYNHLIPMS